jgi:hypothetical protein
MSHADNLSRALLVLILLCLVFLILRGEGPGPEALPAPEPTAAQSGVERYSVRMVKLLRGAPIVLRSDTATGEAWRMGLLAPGQWEALPEGPGGVPSAGAEEPGRYSIHAVAQNRGAFTLVRTDHHTGRIWRKGLKNAGGWVAVPNPGEEAAGAAPAAAPTRAATDEADESGAADAAPEDAPDDADE